MVEKAGREILDRLRELEEKFQFTHDDMYLHPELGLPVFDAAADGVVMINEKLQVVLANKAAERMFGTEIIGKDVHGIIDRALRPEYPMSMSFNPVKSTQGTLVMAVLREGRANGLTEGKVNG